MKNRKKIYITIFFTFLIMLIVILLLYKPSSHQLIMAQINNIDSNATANQSNIITAEEIQNTIDEVKMQNEIIQDTKTEEKEVENSNASVQASSPSKLSNSNKHESTKTNTNTNSSNSINNTQKEVKQESNITKENPTTKDKTKNETTNKTTDTSTSSNSNSYIITENNTSKDTPKPELAYKTYRIQNTEIIPEIIDILNSEIAKSKDLVDFGSKAVKGNKTDAYNKTTGFTYLFVNDINKGKVKGNYTKFEQRVRNNVGAFGKYYVYAEDEYTYNSQGLNPKWSQTLIWIYVTF